MRIFPNPYRSNQVNINLFYGRNSLRHRLVNGLRDGQSFGITGGRRMGKTTLLRRVEADLAEKASQWINGGLLVIPVYIDAQALPHPISPDSIFNGIIQKIQEYVAANQEFSISNQNFSMNAPLHPFAAHLARFINCVSDYRPQIVALFDEVEPILNYDWGQSFFANWRSFLHNEPTLSPYISTVFTGASEMLHLARDIGSPLGNVLTWEELALFSVEDTALLVNEPTKNYLPIQFTEQVFRETGGHPFLIQYIMQFVCNNDLEEADRYLKLAIDTFHIKESDKFERWWEKLPSIAQQIYGQLVQTEKPLSRHFLHQTFGTSDINRALGILCHTGISSSLADQDTYTASGQMFIRWFKQYGVICPTPDLTNQVDQLLKNLERALRKLLREHLEEKYGPEWLTKYIVKITTKNRNGVVISLLDAWCANAKCTPVELRPEDALLYAELGDLFRLIGNEWGDLKTYFQFSKDLGKSKAYFDERKDCLTSVRNALRHVREETVNSTELLKAQVFCKEILDKLAE
ncbi:MAG: hypothetical protein WAZ19_16780 [Anaerolineae bacterium]